MKKEDFLNNFFYLHRHQIFILPEVISLAFTYALLPFLFTEITELPLDSVISAFNPISVNLLFISQKKENVFFMVVAVVALITRTISTVAIILNKTKIPKFIIYTFVIVDLLFVITIFLFFIETTTIFFAPSKYVVLIYNIFAFFYSILIPIILRVQSKDG